MLSNISDFPDSHRCRGDATLGSEQDGIGGANQERAVSEGKADTRKFHRVAFKAPARMTTPAGQWTTRVLDISLKGLLLEHPEGWSGAPGDSNCRIELPLDAQQSIQLTGRIVHSNSRYIGFQWTDIDTASMSHLRRLMELNLGDDREVTRELSTIVNPD